MATVRYTVINGEIISENRNGVRRVYVSDSQGSIMALLDSTQTITDSFDYWPHGEESNRTGTTPTPFRYLGAVGYYRDSSSRDYVRHRVLDKRTGRWMTQDPIGFEGGDVNLYRYVRNNPIRFTDPSGYDLSAGQIQYGNKFCKSVYGHGWHICSGTQWEGCLTHCRGIRNVDFCCSNDHQVHCRCLRPPTSPVRLKPRPDPPGTGPNYPPNNPGSGFGPSHPGFDPGGCQPPRKIGPIVPRPDPSDWPWSAGKPTPNDLSSTFPSPPSYRPVDPIQRPTGTPLMTR